MQSLSSERVKWDHNNSRAYYGYKAGLKHNRCRVRPITLTQELSKNIFFFQTLQIAGDQNSSIVNENIDLVSSEFG